MMAGVEGGGYGCGYERVMEREKEMD